MIISYPVEKKENALIIIHSAMETESFYYYPF